MVSLTGCWFRPSTRWRAWVSRGVGTAAAWRRRYAVANPAVIEEKEAGVNAKIFLCLAALQLCLITCAHKGTLGMDRYLGIARWLLEDRCGARLRSTGPKGPKGLNACKRGMIHHKSMRATCETHGRDGRRWT